MKKKFTTTLNEVIITDIKVKAVKENKSVGQIIEDLLIKYLQEEGN